jgi:Fe2+ transport system protein FeoA
MPPPSRLAGLLSRVFGRRERRLRHRHAAHPHGLLPLSCLHAGERGVIAAIGASDTDAIRKLMALGVLPGATVSIIQTFPSHVLQIGQTQLAVDTALAETITVRLAQGG